MRDGRRKRKCALNSETDLTEDWKKTNDLKSQQSSCAVSCVPKNTDSLDTQRISALPDENVETSVNHDVNANNINASLLPRQDVTRRSNINPLSGAPHSHIPMVTDFNESCSDDNRSVTMVTAVVESSERSSLDASSRTLLDDDDVNSERDCLDVNRNNSVNADDLKHSDTFTPRYLSNSTSHINVYNTDNNHGMTSPRASNLRLPSSNKGASPRKSVTFSTDGDDVIDDVIDGETSLLGSAFEEVKPTYV